MDLEIAYPISTAQFPLQNVQWRVWTPVGLDFVIEFYCYHTLKTAAIKSYSPGTALYLPTGEEGALLSFSDFFEEFKNARYWKHLLTIKAFHRADEGVYTMTRNVVFDLRTEPGEWVEKAQLLQKPEHGLFSLSVHRIAFVCSPVLFCIFAHCTAFPLLLCNSHSLTGILVGLTRYWSLVTDII